MQSKLKFLKFQCKSNYIEARHMFSSWANSSLSTNFWHQKMSPSYITHSAAITFCYLRCGPSASISKEYIIQLNTSLKMNPISVKSTTRQHSAHLTRDRIWVSFHVPQHLFDIVSIFQYLHPASFANYNDSWIQVTLKLRLFVKMDLIVLIINTWINILILIIYYFINISISGSSKLCQLQ